MLKVFCYLRWHTWEYRDGGHRKCKHCGKTQCYIRVGNHGNWQ